MDTISIDLTHEEWGELEKRILANVRKLNGPDGCWEWTGPISQGYPRIAIKGRNYIVSRLVATRWLGMTLSNGEFVVRKCRNRLCLNPSHFEIREGGKPPRNKEELKRKILENIDKDFETGCWNWKRTLNSSGYPYIGVNGKSVSVARVVAWIDKGFPLKSKLFIRHKCDNRKCVNPDHLEWGTNQDNMNDMKRRGRSPNNRGSKNPHSKLKEEDVIMIRILFSRRKSIKDLAWQYGVTRTAISNIVHGIVWKHLPGAIPRDPQIKFSDDQVEDMLGRLGKGHEIKSVAEEYGISVSHLRSIWLGYKRKKVPGPRASSKKPYRVFTEEQVREIRKRYDSGDSIAEIARDMGSHYSTVRSICRRWSWKDQDDDDPEIPEPIRIK